ncbi:unnamed protein product [Ilex paraguariensis]|uniref:X8 domain-containing protein n=1 Tax=Ilex paraguariensis TaxID=185542 RepID=A0ABC8QYZ6_9AQUA
MSSAIALMLAFCMLFTTTRASISDHVGVNWGRQTTQKLLPSMVIDMLLANNIKKVKLFSLTDSVLSAFAHTDIEVMVTIPNVLLESILIDGVGFWVEDNIEYYIEDVNITNVVIGNEPFSQVHEEQLYTDVISVMKEIQGALNEAGYGTIKATTPHFMDVLTFPGKLLPSKADFRDDIKPFMLQVLQHLKNNNSPFVANISPLYIVKNFNHTNLEFAFVDNKSNFSIQDNNITYTNAVDAAYDSFVSALTKNGYPDMKVVVGQVGWPTDGVKDANDKNAERFFKGFLAKMASNKGTPLRAEPFEAYLYNLVDENRIKTIRSPYQRHWGIYKFDGTPKYKIDFSGQGRDIYPVQAKGVVRLPLRWCVFNNDTSNMTLVMENYIMACNESDCSTLAPGGSCSSLDFNQKVSYAFNMYFQVTTQREDDVTCRFDGLSKIVTDNPSNGDCPFPVEILMSWEDGGYGKAPGLSVDAALLMILFGLYWMMVIW